MTTGPVAAAGKLARAAASGAPPDPADLRAAAGAEQPADIVGVAAAALEVLEASGPRTADLCGLASARTGACPEDCAWCAQAARYRTGSPVHAMRSTGDLLDRAREVEAAGAARVCLVTSGRGPTDADLEAVCRAAAVIRRKTRLGVCACLGTLGETGLKRLRDTGISRYNHNLESSERFFPSVCRTHGWQERYETAVTVRRAGLELCSGGILGLGESVEDRIDLLLSLRALAPAVVPVNFLDPRPGTPLAARPRTAPLTAILWIALTRLVLPRAVIKVAGGRESVLRGLQGLALLAGADGLIVGGYLTTPGRPAADDRRMAGDCGFRV